MVKPKVFLDIKTSRLNTYSALSHRVNLVRVSKRANLRTPIKIAAVCLIFAYVMAGFVSAPNQSLFAAAPDAAEKAALEAELADLEAQIIQYEETREAYAKQGASLKSEIDSLNKKIANLNTKIKAVTVSLAKLDREIQENKTQITTTEEKLTFNRQAIMEALQSVYENENVSLVTVLLKNPNLSDFFNDYNNLMDVQVSLTTTVQQITELKQQLLDEKEELAVKRSDAVELKAFQDSQKALVLETKTEKNTLLTRTNGEEKKYQKIVNDTKATAAKIRSRIFALVGGGQMTFEQAYEIAKYAEGAVGVPAAALLAVLDRESRLGANVGRCTYNKNPYYPDRATNQTAMHPTRDIPAFLEITQALGLNPETTQVSCPIPVDGIYGGAIGPGQFLPSTWKLYASAIENITGITPANPWNNSHAFIATALYLKDAGKACSTLYSGDALERCRFARYYAGGNWRRHLYTYGSATLTRMKQFEADIATLKEDVAALNN